MPERCKHCGEPITGRAGTGWWHTATSAISCDPSVSDRPTHEAEPHSVPCAPTCMGYATGDLRARVLESVQRLGIPERVAAERVVCEYRPEWRRERAATLVRIVQESSWEPGPDGIVPEIIARLTRHVDAVAAEMAERALDAALGPYPEAPDDLFIINTGSGGSVPPAHATSTAQEGRPMSATTTQHDMFGTCRCGACRPCHDIGHPEVCTHTGSGDFGA